MMRQIKDNRINTEKKMAWQANLTGQDQYLLGERPRFWWTGCPPEPGRCKGVDELGKIHSLPILNLNHINRQKILDYYDNSWTLTEVLFSSLQGEQAFYRPPYHRLRHPLIFYYGHVTAFYINKLRLAGLLSKPLNIEYERIFEIGVDEMSWDDMSKNDMIWPTIQEVIQYRRLVYKIVKNLILNHPVFEQTKIKVTDPSWSLIMAMEHERIHLETSSVLIRELSIDLVKKPSTWPMGFDQDNRQKNQQDEYINSKINRHINRQKNSPIKQQINFHSNQINMIYLPKQTVQIGKRIDNPFYGWDNEYGSRVVEVKPFYASQHLITNENFLEFVNDNGYSKDRFWKEPAAWRWLEFCQAKAPTFWIKDNSEKNPSFKLRQCFEVIDMPWQAPVIVNFYEAKAYCAWLSEKNEKDENINNIENIKYFENIKNVKKKEHSYRLLTEAEHHCLRDPQTNLNNLTNHESANLNLRYGSEIPVDAMKANSLGFHDVFGNVWQWIEDSFCPLPGFQTHPFYPDFSTPCFDGAHQMILGGSFISTGDEASYFARFHFRPHFFQHAGFRIVQEINS